MRDRARFIISCYLLVFTSLFLCICEEKDYFSKFRVERGEALFFEEGVILSEFKETSKIILVKSASFGDFVTLEINEDKFILGVRKIDGVYHIMRNNAITYVLEKSEHTFDYDESHSYTIDIYEDHFLVTLTEKSYIAECQGWYPFPIKDLREYKWNLKYGDNHKFTVECTLGENYIVEYTAFEGEKIIWNITDIVYETEELTKEGGRIFKKTLIPEFLEISNVNPFKHRSIAIPSINSGISADAIFDPLLPEKGTPAIIYFFDFFVLVGGCIYSIMSYMDSKLGGE